MFSHQLGSETLPLTLKEWQHELLEKAHLQHPVTVLWDWLPDLSQSRLTEYSKNPLQSTSFWLENSFASLSSLCRHLPTCKTHHSVGEVNRGNTRETVFSKEQAEKTVSAICHVTWGRKNKKKKNTTTKQKNKEGEPRKFDIKKSTLAIRENCHRQVGSCTVNQIIQEAEAAGYQVPGWSRLHGEKEGSKEEGVEGEGGGRGEGSGDGKSGDSIQ